MKPEAFPEEIRPYLIPSPSGRMIYRCLGCASEFDIEKLLYTCPRCGQVLLIHDEQFAERKQIPGEQRDRQRQRRFDTAEGIERNRHRGAVGDREDHDDDRQRNHDEDLDEAADHGATGFFEPQDFPVFSRSRISLPVLKNGTFFCSTETLAPVRGLRPVRAGRFLTEKAPKPRSSTRSPRASACVISSRIVFTISSTCR